MKIVFINRFFYPDHSATSQLLSDLAFDFAARGRQVHIVTSRQSYDDPKAIFPKNEIVNNVVIHRVWGTRFGRAHLLGRALDYLSFYVSTFWRLLMTVARDDIVVAKTDPPLISVIAGLCAWLRGGKLVNWIQDVFPEVGQALGVRVLSGVAGSAMRKVRNLSVNGASMNVVLGERMAAHLMGQGAIKARISIIANWADGDAIHPLAPADNPLRQSWGLKDKFIVGYSGNMGRAHEFDTLLGAAELLKDESDIAFLFIGGGHGKTGFEQAIVSRGLGNVHFKPYQPREQLGLSLTLPDIHLISLRPEMEGFVVPSKFYGVAAAGRPVVFIGASDGELALKIARFDCGATIRPDDAIGLASVLRRLRDDPVMVAGMGQRIRMGFDNHYDKPHAVAAWEKLFNELE